MGWLLLDQARPLYEEIGNASCESLIIWTLVAHRRRGRSRACFSARQSAHRRTSDELRAQRRDGICAHVGSLHAGRPPPRPADTTDAAENCDAFAEDERARRRTSSRSSSGGAMRARLLARARGLRGGQRRSHAKRSRSPSLTDASTTARGRAPRSCRGAHPQGRQQLGARRRKRLLRKLLRQKGVKRSASSGAPSTLSRETLSRPPPPCRHHQACFRMAHLLSCAHGRAGPKRPSHDALTGG